MAKLGFKEITPDNWLEVDAIARLFVRISAGDVTPIAGETWLQFILKPKLIDAVPTDVQELFEVARGAMAYAYFFYPLYSLAAEQLFRVVEAAVTHKCEQLGVPKTRKLKTLENKIKWLLESGNISDSESDRLHRLREARNWASHPTDQTILTPGAAIPVLEGTAKTINDLFSAS